MDKKEIRQNTNMPRIMLAGANSGCGKTSITCGILRALTRRGVNIQPYKCGPDYIDPMLHSHITGNACRNLDPFFSTPEDLRYLLAKDSRGADFSVIEGVMGYYDGIGVSSDKSSHTVSDVTETPTVLILNVKGMSHTMIPLIKGLLEYRTNPVTGVILNRCSRGLYLLMKPEIERTLPVKVVGYFPQKEGIFIGSRHLGLMTAAEIDNLDEILDRLGDTAEEGIDLDLLMDLGRRAAPLPKMNFPEMPEKPRARIAVAWDKAFCFYYQENLDILEQMGARLVRFSPVHDQELPPGTDGIYLGGGYPETYREELSDNLSMKESILRAVREGKPMIAECGGFMYACRNLVETDETEKPMLGLIDTDVRMTKRLSMQFGYVEMEALKDTAFFDKGTIIRAHEFHYSKADQRGDIFRISKSTGRSWEGVYVQDHVMAGYPHLYFHNCQDVVRRFVDMASRYGGVE